MSDSTSSPALKNEKISKITGISLPLVEVDLGNLENEVGESSADTLDDSEGERNLVLSVDVGILHTKNVLKVISVLNNEACLYKENC
jgi:hypothetical protein